MYIGIIQNFFVLHGKSFLEVEMRIKYRYAFHNSENEIKNYLDGLNAAYTDKNNPNAIVHIIEIYEDSQYGKKIIDFMRCNSKHETLTATYSQKEKMDAPWLEIWTMWTQYNIMPQSGFPANTFRSPLCEHCYNGCEQAEDFAMGLHPKKWRRAFLNIHVDDEYLVPDRVRDILLQANLRGFHFRNVVDCKTREKLDNINQLVVEGTLPKGRVFLPEEITEMRVCEKCGVGMPVLRKPILYKYRRSIFDGVKEDIMRSGEKYYSNRLNRSSIIISHNFYKALKDSGIDQDLEYYVIEMV
jgi:hypothetical protein